MKTSLETSRPRPDFHGRGAGIATSTCRSCHAEHLGRQADIVGLDREAFDHRVTDFPLLGGHLGATCEACHEAKSRFREAKRRVQRLPRGR